jgi:signal transduction histidine kinase/ligand-binding sensor domain-containing protein
LNRSQQWRKKTLLAGAVCLCLTAFLLCPDARALDPGRHISQYAHTAWRIQDGYFGRTPQVIAQTGDGYLWIGTAAGLIRFDGVRFTPWSPPAGEQLPSSDIVSLLGARDGSLWIGTMAGLSHWRNGKLSHYVNRRGVIASIFEDRNGVVWVARARPEDTTGPLCQVSGSELRCYGKADGFSTSTGSMAVTEDGLGNLWVGYDTGLARWKAGTSAVYSPSGLKLNGGMAGITGIAAKPDGSLWVGIAPSGPGLGLEKLIDGQWKPLVTPELDGQTLEVATLFQDREGALWVGTLKQGIYRLYHDKVEHFVSNEGLSGNYVQRFFEDHEGNLWIVTSKGVDKLRDTAVVTYSTREGLASEEVDSVFASRDGTVWIGGTDSLDALRENKVSSIQAGKGLPGAQVTSLFEDHTGVLWVGLDRTLTIYEHGIFKRIDRPDGSPMGLVVGITEDVENNIWVETSGTPRALLRIRDLKVREQFPAPQMPAARRISADPSGGIWLGLMDGDLVRYRHGTTDVFHFKPVRLPGVEQVSVDRDGSVLAATEFGILGWKNGRQQTLTAGNGLPCGGAYGFVFDRSGALWLTTQCGLVEITRAELETWWEHPEVRLNPKVFDPADGFQPGAPPFAAAARSSDGRLWFANAGTLQMIDPEHLTANTIEPPVHIEEVVADRTSYLPQDGIRLKPHTRDLDIRYTALSFVDPQKVLFRYMLQGQDTSWRDVGERREASYTNLAPGHYRFRVIASNNDGVWSKTGAELNFVVPAAFYQEAWFKILVAVTTGLVLWSLYLFRLRQATAQVQARLNERMDERERIARELHDTLLQGFNGLMLRFHAVMQEIPANLSTRDKMEQVLESADEVLYEGRERICTLRAEAQPGEDLPGSLTSCGEDLAQNYSARFSMAIVGTPQPLEPVVLDEAFQIGREALVNAFVHSNALRIEGEVVYDSASVRLTIRDNGDGIDEEIVKSGRTGHWGLPGMRERARKIGGQLNVWSAAGAGTEVELILPARVAYLRGAQWLSWKRILRAVSGKS